MTFTSSLQPLVNPLIRRGDGHPQITANDARFRLVVDSASLPNAAENARRNEELTLRSHAHLCAFLQGVGNVISPAHSSALQDTLATFTGLAFERGGRRRVAIALPTGMGKTQSIVSWCKVAHEMGIVRPGARSVVVAASQIEALCTLKRDMVRAGVPVDAIGLHHTYTLDPATSGWENVDPPDGYRPPANRASIAADRDAKDRPILLVTHARVGGQDVREFYEFEGMPRSLMIYDETLFRTDAACMDWLGVRHDLAGALDHLQNAEAKSFLSEVKEALQSEIEAQVSTLEQKGRAPKEVRVTLPFDLNDIRSALREEVPTRMLPERLDILLDKLAPPGAPGNALLAPMTVVPIPSDKPGLIQFVPAVSDELDNVAVLDASYHVRRLYTWDISITPVLQTEDELKTFCDVSILHYKQGAGRQTVETSLAEGGDDFFRRLVVEGVKAAATQEGGRLPVLIFTFNREGAGYDLRQGCEKVLKTALTDAGIDLAEQVEVIQGGKPVMKRPINFLTWGSETSRSDLKFCRVVIFAGVLHQSRSAIRARIAGQARDLTVAPTDAEVYDAWFSETVHAVYQGASRGACREVIEGKAGEMLIHLPLYADAELQGVLKAMPGVRCRTIKPLWALEPKIKTIVEQILEFLKDCDLQEVSFRAINKGLKDHNGRQPSRDTKNAAYKFLEEAQGPWRPEGQWMVRANKC